MKKYFITSLVTLLGCMAAFAEPMRISSLHPLMSDLARQVGGERINVFDLVGEGANPHRYEPRPADLKQMQDSVLVLAAGKGLEPYLDRLRSTLSGVPVLEVGETIPSLDAGGHSCESCGHSHHESEVDPHWWHGIDGMRRAARVVAKAFAEKDPDGKEFYMENATRYGEKLDKLKKWASSELSRVPENKRKLVTAHNAFAYFAKEFDFEVIPVAGLNQEQNTSPKKQAKTIEAVKKSGVTTLFPEFGVGRKSLEAIATATGTSLGEELIADGNGVGSEAGFEAMIRHNVTAIAKALSAP
jgi:zinc/manganese transport system substrate-binding protein